MKMGRKPNLKKGLNRFWLGGVWVFVWFFWGRGFGLFSCRGGGWVCVFRLWYVFVLCCGLR